MTEKITFENFLTYSLPVHFLEYQMLNFVAKLLSRLFFRLFPVYIKTNLLPTKLPDSVAMPVYFS